MTWPKISVITPAYNQGMFIERTIRSVLDQHYPNLEYIVMDGGSTDETVKILKKYAKQLTWVSEHDEGQADAINKGLRRSTGSILAYLNSDDTYEPGALKTVAGYFMKHPKAQFVYGRGKLIDLEDNDIGMYNDSQMDHEKLSMACGISQPTAFWTRNVYETIGEFDATYQFTMDYDYWIRISEKYPLHFLPKKVLANTRIHADAKTSRQTHRLHMEALRTLFNHYGKVHYDWINTTSDELIHDFKEGNIFQRPLYPIFMTVLTTYYHLVYNHRLPPKIQTHFYSGWFKETWQRLH